MTDDADRIVAEYQELHRAVKAALAPGGTEDEPVAVVLTKRQLAVTMVAIDSVLEDAEDPATEDAAITTARAKASLSATLETFNVSAEDKAVLRRMIESPWAKWCSAMQNERKAGTDGYRMRAAALGLIVNVFWEAICMTVKQDLWAPAGERLLRQLTAAIRQGPRR